MAVTAQTLPALLDEGGARPDAVFARTPSGSVTTYGEFAVMVAAMAGRLADTGVAPGDRVVVQVEKSLSAVALHVALLRLGVVQVPLNPGYTKAEAAALIADAEPALVVVAPDRASAASGVRRVTLDADGGGSLTADLSGRPGVASWPEVGPSDPAAMLYTSGTTGRPKGAVLSHRNLAANAQTLVRAWGFTQDDNLLHILPLFHTHGLFVALHCVLVSGASMTMLPRFDADVVIAELPNATVMMGVPTHYARLVELDGFDEPTTVNIRLFTSGSAPMTVPLHERVQSRTGHVVLERYGMTETSMLTSNPLEGERKAGTVGPRLPGVDVRVVANGDKCATGDVGDVQVRGANVFGGYWRRADLQSDVFTEDGWFRTGDLGRFDADGYLELVGRSKDLIISGGMNVYPSEIESVLDAQSSVRESAVIGLPDADLGEVVTAVVVPAVQSELDTEAMRAACRDRLAGFKVPKRVIVVEELPRNAMGKVEKAQLRAALARSDGDR